VKYIPYLITIDHGTGSMKVALTTIYGEVLGFEAEETPLVLLPNGGAEQDANGWWQAFLTAAKRLINQNLVPTEEIVAICVSSQWSCTVAVDENGDPLMNAISWMDTRGAPYIRKLMRGFINISGYGITTILKWISTTGGGPGLSGKDPISHILFLKAERPEIYQKTYKFLEAKDFLNLKLSGKFCATFDSIQLHWVTNIKDIHHIHYEPGLIRMFKIDPKKLPDLIKSTDTIGPIRKELADELGLNPDVKVIGGSADLHMAAIGSGAIKDYEGHIYIGTSAFLICHVPHKGTDIPHNFAALPSADPDRYFITCEQECAGINLTFLRDNILHFYDNDKPPYSELDEIANRIPAGSNGVIYTPWLYGERCPVEDSTIRGGFNNLSLKTTMDDMVRAVFEGVAFNARWVLEPVEKFIHRKMDPINIIGGGAVSKVWCQIYADILNRTIRQVKDPVRANARGAAFVASVGLGYMKFGEIEDHIEFSNIFTPNPENVAIYNKIFPRFAEIYHQNAPIHRKLNAPMSHK
jgi:xylulokinase